MVKNMLTELKNHTLLAGLEKSKPTLPLHSLEATEGRRSVVEIGELIIGGPELIVMAGPCSVESETQLLEIAGKVKEAGATVLRGGALKPRTSPWSFQGLGEEGLRLMRAIADDHGLKVVTEATGMNNVGLVARYADMIQIGSRNSQSYELIAAAAITGKPMLLKRGWDSTIEEWLNAAEYALALGNPNVILCERGIRTPVGTILDVNAIIEAKHRTHLPIIADPSHAGQKSELVHALTLSAIAAGADGVIIEVHEHPDQALSDGKQAISGETLARVCGDIASMAQISGRTFASGRRSD